MFWREGGRGAEGVGELAHVFWCSYTQDGAHFLLLAGVCQIYHQPTLHCGWTWGSCQLENQKKYIYICIHHMYMYVYILAFCFYRGVQDVVGFSCAEQNQDDEEFKPKGYSCFSEYWTGKNTLYISQGTYHHTWAADIIFSSLLPPPPPSPPLSLQQSGSTLISSTLHHPLEAG